MKLLFDENLPERLVTLLEDLYPGSSHVIAAGLGGAHDSAIWEFALKASFVIVTKDADFHRLSVLRGAPPKVIHIAAGNCTIEWLHHLLRSHTDLVGQFHSDPDTAFLTLP